MHVSVKVSDLLPALEAVSVAADFRTICPILGNVLIETCDPHHVCLTTTNMQLRIASTIPAEDVVLDGDITLPAKMLCSLARDMPADSIVEIYYPGGGQARVINGNFTATLSMLPASDFPWQHKPPPTVEFSLGRNELALLIDDTRDAISTEETRYYLNGIFLHAVQQGDWISLRAVATDGHRLQTRRMSAPTGAEALLKHGAIVPRETIRVVRSLLRAGDVQVAINAEAKTPAIEFSTGTLTIWSKLIDGTFPDYARVFPNSSEVCATLDNAPLAAAIRRVTRVNADSQAAFKLALGGDGRATVSCVSVDVGIATCVLPGGGFDVPHEIGLEARQTLAVLARIGERVRLAFSDAGAPCVITDPDNPAFTALLMPMRL